MLQRGKTAIMEKMKNKKGKRKKRRNYALCINAPLTLIDTDIMHYALLFRSCVEI